MAALVPVVDVETPRGERDDLGRDMAKHRAFDNPHGNDGRRGKTEQPRIGKVAHGCLLVPHC